MSEQSISQSYTGYWEAYDLQEDPFVEADAHYTSSHWHEYLELLQHLSLYSNVMLAIAGEEDAGRGIFLNQFRTKININIDTHFVKADAYFDHNALLDTIVDAYNFAGIGSNSSDFSDRATSLLTNIERSEKPILIVIDNAHLLSASTLEAMLFFIKEQPADNALLHLVLFGDLELQSKLANLEQQTDSENFVHALELELCSPEETERYLRHKVNQAGTEAVFPFSNQDVLHIHKQSEGYYQRIDRYARDLLLERSSKNTATDSGEHKRSKWLTTSLISVALVATGLGWYQLHKIGSSGHEQGEPVSSIVPQQLSNLSNKLVEQLTSWKGQTSKKQEGSTTKRSADTSSKLSELLKQTTSEVQGADDSENSLVETVEKLRKKRQENEAVIARNEAMVKNRLDALLKEGEAKIKQEASVEKQVESKQAAAIQPSRVVSKEKRVSSRKNEQHPATKVTASAKKSVKKTGRLTAKIEHEKIDRKALAARSEELFGADDLSEYDRELERLKHAASMDNPEEAAVIDKVVSLPQIKQVSAKKVISQKIVKQVAKAAAKTTATAATAATTKIAALPLPKSQPVKARPLNREEKSRLVKTGSLRSRKHIRRENKSPIQNKSLAQIGSVYSLQLVGGHTRANVDGFVRKYGLSGANIIKSTRAGKDWYIVMYGHYGSFDKAKAAIQTLPAPVRGMNPWIRETKNIKRS